MATVERPTVQRAAMAALALRLAGAGYDEIADALGLPTALNAREQVETALEARAWDNAAGRDKLRNEQTARLERLLRSVWGKATNPDDAEHLPAVKVARELIDRLIRLHGLDAPTEVVVHNPTAAEIDTWVAGIITTATHDLRAMEAPVTGIIEATGTDG
jgi:hypothetical protein